MTCRIRLRGVSKRYMTTWALRDVSLEIEGKGIYVLYGHNGSGKSTIIKILTGITRPTKGKVEVCGHDPGIRPSKVLRHLAAAIEGSGLPPYLSGEELAQAVGKERGIDTTSIREAAQGLEVTEYWRRPIFTYSMGMRKKLLLSIALGLAFGGGARALVLDEPYTLLDVDSVGRVSELIQRVGSHVTVVVATHIITRAEESARAVFVLRNGRIVRVLSRERSPIFECPYSRGLLSRLEKVGYEYISVDRKAGRAMIVEPGAELPECTRIVRPDLALESA